MQTANESIKFLLEKAGLPNEPQSAAAQQYTKTHMQEFHQLWQEARKTRPELLFPKRADPPYTAWSGSPEVGKCLIELWELYMPIANKRLLAWEQGLGTTNLATVNLWEDLKPYHSRLDSLMIHYVAYSQELDYVVPPRSIVMTIVNGPLETESFLSRVTLAAKALATSQSL